MTFALVASLLLLPQCWAVLTGRTAALRVFLLALSLVVITAASFLNTHHITLSTATNGIYTDTYYTVTHRSLLALHVGLLTVLASLLWAATRWASPLPVITRPLSTLLALVVGLPVLLILYDGPAWWMPQRYTDYPQAFARFALFNRLAELGFLLCYVSLAAVAIFRLLRRLNDWSKSP